MGLERPNSEDYAEVWVLTIVWISEAVWETKNSRAFLATAMFSYSLQDWKVSDSQQRRLWLVVDLWSPTITLRTGRSLAMRESSYQKATYTNLARRLSI